MSKLKDSVSFVFRQRRPQIKQHPIPASNLNEKSSRKISDNEAVPRQVQSRDVSTETNKTNMKPQKVSVLLERTRLKGVDCFHPVL